MALSLLRATQNTHFPASLMHLNWDSPILTLSFTGCLHNKRGRLVCKTFTNVQFGSLILKIFADEYQNWRSRQKQLVCLCIFITVCINVKLKSANVITSRKSQQLELEIVSVVLLSAGLVSPLPPWLQQFCSSINLLSVLTDIGANSPTAGGSFPPALLVTMHNIGLWTTECRPRPGDLPTTWQASGWKLFGCS